MENQKAGFPLFPPPLEIRKSSGFPHFHSYYGGGGGGLEASPNPQRPKVGQIKPPKWAKRTCQTQMGWIEARRPLTRKAGNWLLEDAKDSGEVAKIKYWSGRRGRPVTLRKPAIMALMRREYLQKPWNEVTRKVCPCGKEHNEDRVRNECQPKLQTVVRILKGRLRDCKITLPEHPVVL